MWQIRTASGDVKEVFGESLDLITLNFNEGANQELCLQVRCLVTNATIHDVFISRPTIFFIIVPTWNMNDFFSFVFIL